MATHEVDMSDYEELGCLQDLFTTQAKKTPRNTAVVNCDGSKVTFEELDKMSDLLASKLQTFGLGKNKVGGILMERSLEYTVSYLAILKAGGAFLPIEVSWPTLIVESVLTDATPTVICTKKMFSDRIAHSGVPVIYLDDNWLRELRKEQLQLPLVAPIKQSLDDKAYVVYSSGTTGKPKGIECPHRGAVFSFTWRHRAYPYEENDREACNVFFVWEMLRPLAKGVPMYIIPDDVIYDPPKLAEFIHKNKITRMLFTPSLLQAILEYKGISLATSFKSLRHIVYCGEVLTTALRDQVASLMPWIQQLNLYSISECHDVANADVTNLRSSNRQFCPVGKLMPGVHALIMDQDLNVKSVGQPGEIYIGGPCLAIGYLKRPDLNKLRFIRRPDHVSESVGERLYRTGDWGYVLSDGSLEVCGRCDTMVKIRGYTIELEAVRNNMLELSGVLDVYIQAFGDEGEDKTLVAFVAPREDIPPSTRDIRQQLKKKLPFYMIPSIFIILNRLPVVEATGKLDVKYLASEYEKMKQQTGVLEVTKMINEKEEPVTKTEMKIAQIWSNLLHVYVLDTEESFFELGGHSLLAAALTSHLNEQFGVKLCTSHIFKHPTISSLASLITDSSVSKINGQINFKEEMDKVMISFSGVDCQIRSYWQTVQTNPNKFTTGNVLLTGATGYVGCFLLQELLLHTQTTIYCLVRESPNMTLLERLQEARQQFGLRKFLPTDRVIPIKGDVSLTNLGLGKDMYSALSLEVDLIIHAAAQVNLILPFSALYNSNVIGTYNVIEFSITGKVKHIHYVSTNGVFPAGVENIKEDDDMWQYCDKLKTGYGQTKWLAEQLVLSAANKGLPTTIYRCGNVGGSRLTSGWNPTDFNFHMLRGVLKTRVSPDIANWQIELTPVDFLSQVIIHLVKHVYESVHKVFHLVNNSTFNSKQLWSLVNSLGYNITEAPFTEWKKLVLERSKIDVQLAQLSQLLDSSVIEEELSLSASKYNQENVSCVLKKMNLVYPALTDDLFRWYIENLSSLGVLPKPKSNRGCLRPKVSLKGKVMLVTGASSGIGEGIARTLATAGATVVLAARRLDRLTSIAQQLKEEGAEAIPVKLDVCNEQEVSACVQQIEATVGPIDVLINNAGVMYYQLIQKCDVVKWNQMVNVNINGTLNCLAAVLNKMVSRGSGHIVNISSDGSRKPFPGLAVYCGTKYFVRCLSGAMRSELASSGIKVTDIQPGDVESELHNLVTDPEAELLYDWSTKVPILKPSEVGEAVLYALSQPSHCAVNEVLIEPQLLPL